MLVSNYDKFVRTTDQYEGRSPQERRDIAVYGLLGEIGSLVAAVKKQLLRANDERNFLHVNDEVIEELGDIVWYCFSLAQIENSAPVNILTLNIAALRAEMAAGDDRAASLYAVIDKDRRSEFLELSRNLPDTREMHFSSYQDLAFLTARTSGRVLLEVCLAVLWQLGAELMRHKLPPVEIELNRAVVDRKTNTILGEIAWHVAAVASLYDVSLDAVLDRNVEKLQVWLRRGEPTPLHDDAYPEIERFPRQFEIAFVAAPGGKSQMYLDGQRFGDELTDNAYDGDGYRFHDVMHVANVAKLGWSPVFRSLMHRKRKSDPRVDEVEDGARARIVEELIIKAIHSEGEKLARYRSPETPDADLNLFDSRDEISFNLLKAIGAFVDGLEVSRNRYWEWEDAIYEGYRLFSTLKSEGQGTLSVDLNARSLTFTPEVAFEYAGAVAAAVAGSIPYASGEPPTDDARMACLQSGVLELLGIEDTPEYRGQVFVSPSAGGKPARVHTLGLIRTAVWEKAIVTFKVVETERDDSWSFSLIALTDPLWVRPTSVIRKALR